MKVIPSIFALIVLGVICAAAQEGGRLFYDGLAWSPDGKSLSFIGLAGTGSDVYVIRADGTGLRKITVDNGIKFGTSWVKGRIVFSSGINGTEERDIYSSNADGSDRRQLTRNAGRNSSPSLSPDGKRIVFLSNREHKRFLFHVHTMNADGSDVRRLTTEESVFYFDPQWSPDGKRIAFLVSKGDSMDQVWTMNADGSNKTLVTGGIGNNKSPGWSPDGKRIILSREISGTDGAFLYTVNADGSGIARLANIKAISARFSPDGKKIAYLSGTFPSTSIYVANADGSGVVKLTK